MEKKAKYKIKQFISTVLVIIFGFSFAFLLADANILGAVFFVLFMIAIFYGMHLGEKINELDIKTENDEYYQKMRSGLEKKN